MGMEYKNVYFKQTYLVISYILIFQDRPKMKERKLKIEERGDKSTPVEQVGK